MISINELLGLEGKTAVVTGAGGVICSKIAEGLCEVGMNVMLLDIDEARAIENAKALKEKFPNQVVEAFFANVLDKRSLESAKKRILSFVDKIDFLVNGAGGNSPKATTQVEEIVPGENEGMTDFFDLEMEGFDHVFNLNFKGTILPTMVFGNDLVARGEGGVLNISSMNAFTPLTKIPAYSAAKSSINNFTQWLAVHFAKTGVRVNAIAPGFFVTTQNKFLLFDKNDNLTPRGQKIINGTPMGRYGEIDELVGTTVYLLSNMSKFVTGIVVPIDGGYSAYSGV